MVGKKLVWEAQRGALPLWDAKAEAAAGAACASYKTCDECLNSTHWGCHFCEADFQCHAIMSGCAIGVDKCHHMDECIRHEPQFVGYGPPPSVVIAVLCLVVTLTCCVCGLSAICTVFMRASKRKAARRARSAPDELPGDVEASGLLETIGEEDELAYYEEDAADEEAAARLRRLQERSERSMPWKSYCTRLLWVAALAGMTVFALMFYPRLPDYNVCNRQFEWESILHSLTSLSPKIEYQVLMSIINENRFGFLLESGYADIYHNNTHVGVWELNHTLEAKAGSITDVLAPVHLQPGYAEAFSLLYDFNHNKLVFHINASITGSITWGKHKLYRVDSASSDIEFLVGADYPRTLCNCSQFVTNQRGN